MFDASNQILFESFRFELSQIVIQDVQLDPSVHTHGSNQSVNVHIAYSYVRNTDRLMDVGDFIIRRYFGIERVPRQERQLSHLKQRNEHPESHSRRCTDTKKVIHRLPRVQLRQDETHLFPGRLEYVAVQGHQESFESLVVSREVKYLEENQYFGEVHEASACHDFEVVQIHEYFYGFDEGLEESEKNYCKYRPQSVEVGGVAVLRPKAQDSEADDVFFDGGGPIVMLHYQQLKKKN
jgi:hypothetical protein